MGSDKGTPLPHFPTMFKLKRCQMISKLRGYKMGNKVCYIDESVLLSDSQDNLQRLLHTFNTTIQQNSMKINTQETNSMSITK